MMVASLIMTLVIAGVGTAFVAVLRLSRTALAESELAIRMRELREKLLFHAAPPHDGKVWAGLLSGEKGVEAGVKVRTTVEGFDTATGAAVAQRIELVIHQDMAKRFFVNDGDRTDDGWEHRWLVPGGIGMLPASDVFGDAKQESDFLYTIGLEASAEEVTRRERIVVPLFGWAQVKSSGSVFHD